MLEFRHITKRFGTVTANNDVSFHVAGGTIHAVVGENGAGKSTAMRIAYGVYRPDSGDILIDGHVRRLRSPHDAIAYGVGMVHQHFTLVDAMSVVENIVLGDEPGAPLAINWRVAAERVRALSHQLGLAVDPAARVARLSVGQRQRVEILKALYRDVRLVILDEPTAVLTPPEVVELFGILRRLRERGRTVVIVTHKLSEVLAISDAVTVMRNGRVVGHRATREVNAAELARLMVGRDVPMRVAKSKATPGGGMLRVVGLCTRAAEGAVALKNVSFEVRAGEIVGIAGVDGNGQTELIEAIAGLTPPADVTGSIVLDGHNLRGLDARRRKEIGIAHVPEDRQRRGLVLDFSLADNAILGAHYRPPVTKGPGHVLFDLTAIASRARAIVCDFEVRPPDITRPARVLSGGNQQKLVIGRESALCPKLLLASQPTRGVDIGALELIHRRLIALRDAGCAVLVVSADLDEVTTVADRLLVFQAGRIAGELDPQTATGEQIGLLMSGVPMTHALS
jgi:simple sugar transport system ATP-binding protein